MCAAISKIVFTAASSSVMSITSHRSVLYISVFLSDVHHIIS